MSVIYPENPADAALGRIPRIERIDDFTQE